MFVFFSALIMIVLSRFVACLNLAVDCKSNALKSAPHCLHTQNYEELAQHLKQNVFPGLLILENNKDPSYGEDLMPLAAKCDEFDHAVDLRRDQSRAEVTQSVESLLPKDWIVNKAASLVAHDILVLADMMFPLLNNPRDRLVCRLNLMTKVRCPKWHEDYVDIRLIKTYCGPGTDWVDPSNNIVRFYNWWLRIREEDPEVPIQSQYQQSRAGDVLVMSGRKRQIQNYVPVLHRSPMTSIPRLLLSITVEH